LGKSGPGKSPDRVAPAILASGVIDLASASAFRAAEFRSHNPSKVAFVIKASQHLLKNEKEKTGMAIKSFSQQGIVFAVFAVLFAVFSFALPGFLSTDNMLTLLQNVAVLGILGLAMAIVVIGRGIDISLIAALAVPPGLVLQMVQDGHSLPTALVAAFGLVIVFGFVNGWLIAYAEVPSLFTTLASGLFLAGLGQAALFKLDVVQWSPGMDGFERLGQGNVLGIPMSIVMFVLACAVVAFLLRRTRIGAYIYAIGDNPYAARVTGIPTRPMIVLQYVLAAVIGCSAGLILASSVNSMPTRIFNSTLIYDVILVVVLGGIGLSGGRGGVLNVIIGTLLIGTMLNGMTIMDVSYSGQNLIKGVVLLAAVIADSFLNPRNEETAQQGDI
jgi:ribose transport system permease protein